MLVLSRKADERIMIGDDIELYVVEVRGNRVRLGFTAPEDVRILRGELIAPRNQIVSRQPDILTRSAD